MTASPYIAVAGGVNIDIGGRSDAPLVAGDSNPGRIRSSLGGVGRNIAHNLALLGAKVRLITALGADDGAKRIEASCADLGIDLTDSLYVPDGATSTYLFLADSNGDMALAMNDMAIYEHLTPAFLETKLNALNAAALVVLDTNLSAESIRYLGEHCTAPLFADPVSAAKAGKLEPILGRLHTLKPNRMEAELPGFRKEDISLSVKEDVLTVAAHREKEQQAGQYVCRERRADDVRRSFDVSAIEQEGIRAAFENGVLVLTLPKASAVKPERRSISIQ